MDPTLVTAAATSFVTAIATNSVKTPLKTLDELWYLAFGSFSHYVDKLKAKREFHLEDYKKSITKKISNIDENNLQEPSLSIVGPALEASKYYIEEEVLREMFANVIAASMDKTKSATVHNSFVEIIKQLSPEDAINISLFKTAPTLPIVELRVINIGDDNKGYNVLKTNIFSRSLNDVVTGNENAASITNLSRLGLITFSYDSRMLDIQPYQDFENSIYYKQTKEKIVLQEPKKLEIKHGLVDITPFGQNFIKTCL